jgi:alanine racemase
MGVEARGGKRTTGHMDPWIEVDLSTIARNFAKIRERVKVPIMAVVKANAYGHGLVEVSRTLEKAGAG